MQNPAIRFKKEDGTDYPDLEEKTLGGVILSLHTGLNPRKFFQLNTPDANNYYVTIREIQNNRIEFTDKTDKINDEAMKLCNNRSNLEAGDVLFSGTGTVGAAVLVRETPQNWNIKEGVYAIKPDKKMVDSKYLLYLITSSGFRNRMFKMVVKGTMTSIPMEQFRKTNIYMPCMEEQKKIGNFLSNIDEIISATEKELEDYELQKKDVMKKIFSQEVKFKADDGTGYPDWEELPLAECFDERRERASGNEVLLSVTLKNGVIKQSESNKKDVSNNDKSNYKVVKKNDIAYNSMRMWQGAEGVSSYDGMVSPAYTILIPKDICSKYFEYFFKMPNVMYVFQRYSIGLTSDTWNLRYKTLSKLKFKIPCIQEQKKIVDFLSAFDEMIDEIKKELECWKQIKKGLLQQMFV